MLRLLWLKTNGYICDAYTMWVSRINVAYSVVIDSGTGNFGWRIAVTFNINMVYVLGVNNQYCLTSHNTASGLEVGEGMYVVDRVQVSCCISAIWQGQGNCPRRQLRIITLRLITCMQLLTHIHIWLTLKVGGVINGPHLHTALYV